MPNKSKAVLDNVDRTLPVWTATSSEGTVEWNRFTVDQSLDEYDPICDVCNSTIHDTDAFWLCADGGETHCNDCVTFSTKDRNCPECGKPLHFCDDGESDEYEKKIYFCPHDECPTEFVHHYRIDPTKT